MDNIKFEQNNIEKSMVNLNEIIIKIKLVEERAIENVDELNKLYDLYRTLRACYYSFGSSIQRLRAIPIEVWKQILVGENHNLDEFTNYLKRVDTFFKEFREEIEGLPKLHVQKAPPIIEQSSYGFNQSNSFPTFNSLAKGHLQHRAYVPDINIKNISQNIIKDIKFIGKPEEYSIAQNCNIISQDDSSNYSLYFSEPKVQFDVKKVRVHNTPLYKRYTEFNKCDVNNVIEHDAILRGHLGDNLNMYTIKDESEEINDINADTRESLANFNILSYVDNPSKIDDNQLNTINEDIDVSTAYSDPTTELSITKKQNLKIKNEKFIDDLFDPSIGFYESAGFYDTCNNMIGFGQPDYSKLDVNLKESDSISQTSSTIIQNSVKDDKFIDDLIEACIEFHESGRLNETSNNVICYAQSDESKLDVDLKDNLNVFDAKVDEIDDKDVNEKSLHESSIINYVDISTINVVDLETNTDIIVNATDLQVNATNCTSSDVSSKPVTTAVYNLIENEPNSPTEVTPLTRKAKSGNEELSYNAIDDDVQLEAEIKARLNTIQVDTDLALPAFVYQLPSYSEMSDSIRNFESESYSDVSSFIESRPMMLLNSRIEVGDISNASDTEILLAFEPNSPPSSESSSDFGIGFGEELIYPDFFSDINITPKQDNRDPLINDETILSLLEEVITSSLENVNKNQFQDHPLVASLGNQWKHVMINNTIDIKLIQAHYVNDVIGYCRFIANAADLQDQNFIRLVMVGNEIAGIELLN